jgi:glyoxylase-like metal-dependent hydrolase (beta-lactamase superfamily II)
VLHICETGKVLTEICDGVLVRQSAFCQSNAVVVVGSAGVLLVDPGVDGDDLRELADDLERLGHAVVAGFSTHPHWDHMLWHEAFGEAPRYGTARCAATGLAWISDARKKAARLAPGARVDLLGVITPLPPGTKHVPWDGPAVRIVEHQAHAPGHAALNIEGTAVLLAGDMLSDVEIPLLDLRSGSPDPLGDYVQGLELLAETVGSGVDLLVPGHGRIARGGDILARIGADQAYLDTLQSGADASDPRLSPMATYGTDWLPREHERQVRAQVDRHC